MDVINISPLSLGFFLTGVIIYIYIYIFNKIRDLNFYGKSHLIAIPGIFKKMSILN